MPPTAEPSRARTDACPGALTTHQADDGPLARVRLPGGVLTAEQLGVLAECADELGDGALQLTSRGNVQLRAVTDPAVLASRLADAGLLPSASHERVRNILASPLSGLVGGLVDVRPLVCALDGAVCDASALAALPGRFLFGLDDGRGDIVDDRIDVCWRAVSGSEGALLLAGSDSGVRVALGDAVSALVVAAAAFASVRGDAWQVRELGERRAAIVDAVRTERRFQCVERSESVVHHTDPAVPVGAYEQYDGRRAIGASLVLGMLTSAQARLVAGLAPSVLLTPWRSVLVPDVAPGAADGVVAALSDGGLVLDPDAPELAVSACIGRPGCAKARADVRADATRAMSGMAALPGALPRRAHFSGCERRCGRPTSGAVDVLATGDGYLVNGSLVPAARLAETLVRKEPW